MADQSNHSKYLEILALIRKHSPISSQDLIEKIRQKIDSGRVSCFIYFRKDGEGNSHQLMCKNGTVAGHIKLLQAIGLVTDLGDLELTGNAKAATKRSDINGLIHNCLIRYMEKRGCPFEALLRSINRVKISDARNIYKDLDIKGMSEYNFRKFLFLLSKTGNKVIPYQRKIYTIGK